MEWSYHNPEENVYTKLEELDHFIQLAKDEDLYVILRPGPYICAEREMGGIPHWILNKYPNIQLRTADSSKYHKNFLDTIMILI